LAHPVQQSTARPQPAPAAEPEAPPRLSLRLRIIAGFLLCFLLALSITVASYYVLVHLKTKLHFLEVADTLVLELQQARRLEKNYFLYGTNLADALAHVQTAQQLLQGNAGQLAEVVGPVQVERLREELAHYAQSLEGFCRPGPRAADGPERAAGEAELRRHGSAVLAQGLQLVQQERQAVARMFRLAQQVPIVFLAVLFLVMAFLAHKLSRQIIGPLSRLKKFTQRVARGDFTPLQPTAVYQDELYELTQALNRMITELHHRQEILMQSQKLRALGTLTAGVAHELNNPINNITLTAYSLRDDGERLSDQERLEMIQEVIKEADRLRGIVKNLLDYARESEFSREPLDLGQLVEETLLLVKKQLQMAGAHLTLDLPPQLPTIRADRRQLRQVLLNILINALDAIPPQGHIQIAVRQEDPETVAVTIRDDGPGIAPEVLPYIFDPFFTTKPPGRGTGLGLAVSQGIVNRHGGEIRVASSPGQGAAFTVVLPVG